MEYLKKKKKNTDACELVHTTIIKEISFRKQLYLNPLKAKRK